MVDGLAEMEGFVFLEGSAPGIGKSFITQQVLPLQLEQKGVTVVSVDCRAVGFKMKDEDALKAGNAFLAQKCKAAAFAAPAVLLLDSAEDLVAEAEADPAQPFRLIRSEYFIAAVKAFSLKDT